MKEMRKRFKKLQTRVSSVTENLHQEVQRNERLDSEVQSYHQRKSVKIWKGRWPNYKNSKQKHKCMHGGTIEANKLVLASSSSYFKSLLKNTPDKEIKL